MASCAALSRHGVASALMRRLVGTLMFALVVVGCGGGEGAETSEPLAGASAQPSATTAAAPDPPKPRVRLAVHNRRKSTQETTVVVKGVVTRGAMVTVRGEKAQVRKGRFRKTIKLKLGRNRFTVVARHPDRRTTRGPVRIRRVAPPPAPSPPAAPPPPSPPPVAAPGPAAPPSSAGYPPPGECGISPYTGDPVCTQSDGSLELNTSPGR